MKKYLVSVFFIFGFVINSIYQRSVDAYNSTYLTKIEDVARGKEAILERNYFEENIISTIKAKETPSTSTINEVPIISTPTPVIPQGKYRNGIYTGNAADAGYGVIQVKATIINGKISGISFLSYPNDRPHSVEVSNYAMPILRQEAIAIQSENVDAVSGASYTSAAFVESLGNALAQAK